jgi:DNA-binding NtrC family response regulator
LYDLIVLDQGDRGFEGHEVLARAMEVDPELRVLVLARSHDSDCYGEAMQSGALDCLEGPLNAAEMVALLETYLPSGTGSRRNSANLVEGAEPGEQCVSKAQSNHVHLEKRASGSYREQLQL